MDTPYEWNAGEPYQYYPNSKSDADCGKVPWKILRIAFDTEDWERPCDNHQNSTYCVRGINAGIVPWLKTHKWIDKDIKIMAGATLREFYLSMKSVNSTIYLPYSGWMEQLCDYDDNKKS